MTLALALLVAAALRADDAEPPDPKMKGKVNGPLTVRLVAKKTTYILDREGKTAEAYRRAAKNGDVAPPAVDLVLEITNTSKENVTVRVAGAVPALTFKLSGPKDGAVIRANRLGFPGKAAPARAPLGKGPRVNNLLLKPGAKHEIVIKALDSTAVSRPRGASYWTEPGNYTLSAELETVVSDANGKNLNILPKGVKRATPTRSVLLSQQVKLTVQAK
jgi:hypothetical protein